MFRIVKEHSVKTMERYKIANVFVKKDIQDPIEKDLQNDVSFNYVRPVRQIQL